MSNDELVIISEVEQKKKLIDPAVRELERRMARSHVTFDNLIRTSNIINLSGVGACLLITAAFIQKDKPIALIDLPMVLFSIGLLCSIIAGIVDHHRNYKNREELAEIIQQFLRDKIELDEFVSEIHRRSEFLFGWGLLIISFFCFLFGTCLGLNSMFWSS